MMALKYFDKRIKLSKELEMDIWREANMSESYGTSRFGLAFSAAKRGFEVRTYSNVRGPGFVKKIDSLVGKIDYHLLEFFLAERKKRSIELGAKESKVSMLTENLLRRILISGSVPIVLSNTEYFGAEDIPHWIVISGIDESNLYVNNPLDRKGQKRVPLDSLNRVTGYKGDRCMIAVSKGMK